MKLLVKNWRTFQHYTGRTPPWIKLQRTLLDDRDFQCLPLASKALAPMLWLLASESSDGVIEGSIEDLAWRLRWTTKDIAAGLGPLIEKGFLSDASETLAECLQDACVETEGETETEGEKYLAGKPARKKRTQLPIDFFPDETGVEKVEQANLSLAIELNRFRDYHTAKGSVMADWQAAWRTWVGNAVKFRGQSNATNANSRADVIAAFTGSGRQPAVFDGTAERVA